MTMKAILQFVAIMVMAMWMMLSQDGHVCGMNITNQSDPLNETIFTDFTDDNETNWLFNVTTESPELETTSSSPITDLPHGPCGECPAMSICATYWPSCTPPPHDCLLTADCKDYACKPTHVCEPYEPIFG